MCPDISSFSRTGGAGNNSDMSHVCTGALVSGFGSFVVAVGADTTEVVGVEPFAALVGVDDVVELGADGCASFEVECTAAVGALVDMESECPVW